MSSTTSFDDTNMPDIGATTSASVSTVTVPNTKDLYSVVIDEAFAPTTVT